MPERAGLPGEFIAFHVYGSGCTIRGRTVTLALMPTIGSSHRDAAVVVIGHVDVVGMRPRLRMRCDVVGVVGGERELDEPSVRRVDDTQLVATVGGGEHAVGALGQAELAVELLRRVDVGHAERHLGKTVQGHRVTPMCLTHAGIDVLPLDVRHVKKISILRAIPESA